MLLIRNKRIRTLCGFLECFNFLMFKLLLKNRSMLRVFPGIIFRDYMSLVRSDKWRCENIFDIFPGLKTNPVEVTLKHMHGEGIFTPVDELAYLTIITKHLKPKVIFEIGTFRGRTALNFALNSPEDGIVYTMDLPQNERNDLSQYGQADAGIVRNSKTGVDYQESAVEHKIKQLYGDSLTYDFSAYYKKVDIVFIDGGHFYEVVCKDIENGLKMLTPGGIIVMHDFAKYGDYNDVTRAALDLLPQDKLYQISNTQLAVYQS